MGIVLSEQSNYPIKIGPGPHLIVSGVQVSDYLRYRRITNTLHHHYQYYHHPDTAATKSQTVRIPVFKDPPLCLQK